MDKNYKYDKNIFLSNIYKKLIISSQININPDLLNINILDNIKQNLKRQELNKCNRYGLITNIYNIDQKVNGILSSNNQVNSSVIFKVNYYANICIPLKNDCIPAKIIKKNNQLLLAIFEKIKIVIDLGHTGFNANKFTKENTDIIHNKTKKELNINDNIIIKIIDIKFHPKDTEIKAFGFLYDYYEDNEIVDNYIADIKKENTNVSEITMEDLY